MYNDENYTNVRAISSKAKTKELEDLQASATK
mgnify:CR=1 FL=1